MAVRKAMSVQEMRFAELVAGGMSTAEAYRRAGYVCKNDHVARSGGAALMRRPAVVAYIEKRLRENLAVRDITLGGQIVELAKLANTPGMEPEQQASIRMTLIKVLLKVTPLPAVEYVLPETVSEEDIAKRAVAVVEATMQGKLNIEQGERLMSLLQQAADVTHSDTIAREIRGQIDVTPPPSRQLAVVDGEAQQGKVVRPKWLKPPGGKNGGGNGSDPAA